MIYGLIGRKLPHSLSPLIHQKTGCQPYELCELEAQELDDFFSKRDFKGINVTIPYKTEAFRRCDTLSPLAQRIGCVNTIVKRDDGTLYGDNTDYYGLYTMMKNHGIDANGKKALILGGGGSSLTARAVLEDMGASEIVVISRTGENNYTNLHLHADASVIVNTTPVGMYPDSVDKAPVDLSLFPNLQGVADLIFNPLNTKLVQQAQERGLNACGGISMLVGQGFRAAEQFRNCEFTNGDLQTAEEEILKSVKNVVLIGMPGCGKSTLGKLLAEHTGREFLDTDSIIEQRESTTIPEIFAQHGEEYFRNAESAVVAEISQKKGAVIAVGGGAVLREENQMFLRQNSTVVFIQRDIASLATDGRPLSKNLEEMYAKRLPIYKRTCHKELLLTSDSLEENLKLLAELTNL